MSTATDSTQEQQLEKFYLLIASDVMLAKSALQYCYLKIEDQNYGKWDNVISTISKFATVTMSVHACRSFEVHNEKLIREKRKYPAYSFYHLAHFLENGTLSTTVDMFIPFAMYLNEYDAKCDRCDKSMQFRDPTCLKCLPKRLGEMIRKRCDEYADLIKSCKDFRDKWVAHAEMPLSGVSTTYADYLRLYYIARGLLHTVSFYMLNGLHYDDIGGGKIVNKFNSELLEMQNHLLKE